MQEGRRERAGQGGVGGSYRSEHLTPQAQTRCGSLSPRGHRCGLGRPGLVQRAVLRVSAWICARSCRPARRWIPRQAQVQASPGSGHRVCDRHIRPSAPSHSPVTQVPLGPGCGQGCDLWRAWASSLWLQEGQRVLPATSPTRCPPGRLGEEPRPGQSPLING